MSVITMKQLLEAGAFWAPDPKVEPKMVKYIYASRNDIHIIDLQITVSRSRKRTSLSSRSWSGKPILFVGTKLSGGHF